MKSITIHGLEDNFYLLISQKAKKSGLSLNKTIKALLMESLNISIKKNNHKKDFIDFLGTWNDADNKEFIKNTESLRKINSEDW